MDSLKLLHFSSFIIFSDDPWSLLVSFRQLFKLPLVVQCCDVICEWPLICIECRDQVHVIPRQTQHLTGGMQNPTTETGAWCLFCNGEARLVQWVILTLNTAECALWKGILSLPPSFRMQPLLLLWSGHCNHNLLYLNRGRWSNDRWREGEKSDCLLRMMRGPDGDFRLAMRFFPPVFRANCITFHHDPVAAVAGTLMMARAWGGRVQTCRY